MGLCEKASLAGGIVRFPLEVRDFEGFEGDSALIKHCRSGMCHICLMAYLTAAS